MKHCYERNIVEIREEYTNFLMNIITPLLYEGVQSLYNYAGKTHRQLERQTGVSDSNPSVLKLFQTVLKELPNLNTNQIENETNRIKEASRCSEWFTDLLKAVIKSNIVLLTYSNSSKRSPVVDAKYHDRVDPRDFVHKCYIEMARAFYDNPELFVQEYPSLKVKKNQREACAIIRTCIKQAVRKMLPIKLILQEYLMNDYVDENEFTLLDKEHYTNIRNMVDKDVNLLDSSNKDDKDNKEQENEDYKQSKNSFEEFDSLMTSSDSSETLITPSDLINSVERGLLNIKTDQDQDQDAYPDKNTTEMHKETFIIKQALNPADNPIGQPTNNIGNISNINKSFLKVIEDPAELILNKRRPSKDDIRFKKEIEDEIAQSKMTNKINQPDKSTMKNFFANYT